MSTAARRSKKKAIKVFFDTPLKLWICANQADPGPPLGPQIGQRGINVPMFCKDFNEKTKNFIPGIPIPSIVSVKPDKTHHLEIRHPPLSYFIRQASGVTRGLCNSKSKIAGKITVKHVYEIAKLKSEDPEYDFVPLEKICQQVINQARSFGIQVVHRLDPVDYDEFLKERKKEVVNELKELQASRESKILRT